MADMGESAVAISIGHGAGPRIRTGLGRYIPTSVKSSKTYIVVTETISSAISQASRKVYNFVIGR